MSRIVLDEGGVHVKVDPALGAGIAEFMWRPPGRGLVHLMRPAPERTRWFNDMACYGLAPWSNRIDRAAFAWRGQAHQVLADWPDGTAIHGLVKDRPWRVEQRSPDSVLLTLQSCNHPGALYPWPFSVEFLYVVSEMSLLVTLSLTHEPTGTRTDPMPAGLGFHPFWRRSLDGASDEAIVRMRGLRRYVCARMIPREPPREDDVTRVLAAGTRLTGLNLDDVFAGSSDGADITWPGSGVRVRYRCSANLGHTVLYSGRDDDQTHFCLEPVSMVNDGFNLESRGWKGTGVRSLAPGESLQAKWVVEVGAI